MARTYPMQSVDQFKAGQPWGPRSTDTGTPLTGTIQNTILTLLGTPQAVRAEAQDVTCSGTFAELGSANLTLDATPYDYMVVLGNAPTDVATGLALLAVADPNYTVTSAGPVISVVAKIAGAWAGSITCGYTPVGAEDGSLTAAVVTVGADANTYAVSDGASTSSYTVLAGNTLADCAAGLGAKIAGTYGAIVHGTTVLVSAAAGVSFALTDASINNIAPGGSIAVQAVTPAIAGPLTVGSPGVISTTNVDSLTLWNELLAGFSYDVQLWALDLYVGAWLAFPKVTITASAFTVYDVRSIPYVFVALLNFDDASVVALNTVMGDRLTPGFQG